VESEQRLIRIARLARLLLDVPAAALCTLDGTEAIDVRHGDPRAAANITRRLPALLATGPVIVRDVHGDERLVRWSAEHPTVRFFAAFPLRDREGALLGTLCLFDFRPRSFSPDMRHGLEDLAAIAAEELQIPRLRDTQEVLISELDAAQRRASVDALTGLLNRGAILDRVLREAVRASVDGSPFAVLMVDLDHFKLVNDTFGHLAGDDVLRVVAARLRQALRPTDAVGRYGGEEFLVVLSDEAAQNAVGVAARMLASFRDTPIATRAAEIHMTISIGVAQNPPSLAVDVENLVAAADDALYAAKRNGRDRFEVACFPSA